MVGLSIVSLAFAAPALAASDPFEEFRIPDHRSQSGTAVLDFTALRGRQGGSRHDLGLSDLDASFVRARDSDRIQHSASVEVGASVDWNRSTSPSGLASSDRSRSQAEREHWRLDLSLRSYPWDAPVGLDASIEVSGAYEQSWTSDRERYRYDLPTPPRELQREHWSATHDYDYAGRLAFATGLGRVRDATMVYSVHVLEERLRDAGTLVRELSPAARERLAALFYVEPSFGAVHDRPDRFAWREVERILREDGALSEGGLDAYGVLRGREPVRPQGLAQRRRGWFAGPVASLERSHAIHREDERATERYLQADTLVFDNSGSGGTLDVDSPTTLWGGASAEIHRPLGWRWQFDLDGNVTRPLRTGERGLHASMSAQARWVIADRWDAQGALTYLRDTFGPRDFDGRLATDDWQAYYAAGLGFYLEDHLTLSFVLTEFQRVTAGRWDREYERAARFQLRLTYRFLGALDAPGLLDPVRPLR